MDGLHLTADLFGCPAAHAAMSDAALLRRLCLDAVGAAGPRPVADLFHRFDGDPARTAPGQPSSITGVVLLAESHLALHTGPELGTITLDICVFNFADDNSPDAQHLLEALCTVEVRRQALMRGRRALDPVTE